MLQITLMFLLAIVLTVVSRQPFSNSIFSSSPGGQKELLSGSSFQSGLFSESQSDTNNIGFNSMRNSFKSSPTTKDLESQYHGTTTLGFKYNQSVILCVDSKASMGQYIGSRTVRKVMPITKTMVATMAGGAADCSYWIKHISTIARQAEFEYSSPFRVTAVARLLASIMRQHRGSDLSIGTMIAGYDIQGPELYYVDSEGSCVSGERFCVGSGSRLAYSILDAAAMKTNSTLGLSALSREEAVETALWAVRHATARDGYSGGYINVLEVNQTGTYHLKRVDCRDLAMSL